MSILGRIRAHLVPARLWLGEKRYDSLGSNVIRVSETRLIKGPCESAELEGLEYIAKHTSIPVPKVHRAHRVDGHLYIEMEYIQGDTLQDKWIKSRDLSVTAKQAIVKQVAAYVDELRRLEPPQKGIVASADLGKCLDVRVGFHDHLRGQTPLEDATKVFDEAVTVCHSRQYRTCFAHADLCPRNIIVRDGEVAAIIDWQFAGWYPEYWEYTKAHFGILDMPDWYEELRNAIPRYDDELAAERVLWVQLDQPGMFQCTAWRLQTFFTTSNCHIIWATFARFPPGVRNDGRIDSRDSGSLGFYRTYETTSKTYNS
ncbi:kinase-like domain-containing protein [Aspergillus avenaceus]|uniref:Kinase-like domain-containing protein n=1 Tax=Aspergillus avenaceus TaxID=36643 RepID=A0A5N6TP28_ASPAV|nr:kinase-like domain-containing protein [Aspergillus avenaceus]